MAQHEQTSNERYAHQLLARLTEWSTYTERIKAQHQIAPSAARYTLVNDEIRPLLPPDIENLYTHQYEALRAALGHEHVTIATATASGKTYAMALPSRVRRHRQPGATLLCVAPTRALIQQWQERLSSWDPALRVEVYTGDTPQAERAAIRQRAQAVITTPDMLHMGLLPYHRSWAGFLSRLQDVIVDESHMYRGVFGSHVALILRRLKRVLALHNAQPSFIFGSATIGNPEDHAVQLIGDDVSAITANGAPAGGRLTLLWQPPDDSGYVEEAAGLLAFFITQGVRSILFGQARQTVERMVRLTRSMLPSYLQMKVLAYRAGYTVEQRREIEDQLARGEILGIISTSALEVGIDVGDLDVSIVAGFPGSISSFWQQAGRAGRRNRSALSIFVLREDALDQYFAAHPSMLLDQPAERALVNINNPYIFPRHLLCAAYEQPLSLADQHLFGPATAQTLARLVEERELVQHGNRYYLRNTRQSVAFQVSLRQVGERLSIMSATTGSRERRIEETDIHHAISECHPGAIYYSQGVSYEVQQLDLAQKRIDVRPHETAFYTEPIIQTDVQIQEVEQHQHLPRLHLYSGRVLVTREVQGFLRRHNRYRTILEQCELEEPLSAPLETRALWMLIDNALIEELISARRDPAGALHAVEHGMIALLPLFVLGDRRDVGGVSVVPYHPQTRAATIFIYDGYPGGIGYSEEAFRQWSALAQATLETLRTCSCAEGCYACIMSPKCGNQNRPLDKAGAIYLLNALLYKKSTSH
ncbi:DEAD/DEAH box helicase [Ktedonospora formicarum]|uniref:Helicase n=1 Tax=Ktedonospora formicarum TaxID=2778364 RepID=A0A8J3MUF6_9CHLR|nr:DEAD/DEAH box helicase [Ktedonospora formicarum]GHO49302.1 helicase [Ktedonospora formicarum]